MMQVCVFMFSSLFHIFIFYYTIRVFVIPALPSNYLDLSFPVCDNMLFDLILTAFNSHQVSEFQLLWLCMQIFVTH